VSKRDEWSVLGVCDEESWVHIMMFLDSNELCQLCAVSKYFNNVINKYVQLRSKRFDDICVYIALNDMQSIKYIHADYYDSDVFTLNIYHIASVLGNIDCLKYIAQFGAIYSPQSAAARGHIEWLKYIWTNYVSVDANMSCYYDVCLNAALYGHLDCLKFAHAHGAPFDYGDSHSCRYAAIGGHLRCLIYVHKHGGSWGARTCWGAAAYGHLNCLKYAFEHGCNWNHTTCKYAAKYGNLDCLKYAYEYGCNINKHACIAAIVYAHQSCVKSPIDSYIYQSIKERGCPEFIRRVSHCGHMDCLNYLRNCK
jgi:hypothetical protein